MLSQTVALNHEIKLLQILFLKLLPCSIFGICIHDTDKMSQAMGQSKTGLYITASLIIPDLITVVKHCSTSLRVIFCKNHPDLPYL